MAKKAAPKKKAAKPKDERPQRERFLDAARKAGVDESGAVFDRAVEKLFPGKRKSKR